MVTGVEFDEDKFSYAPTRQNKAPGASGAPDRYNKLQYSSRASGLSGWLISHGWAKSEKAAQGILLAIVVINIIITYIVVKYLL
jgi:hypothetical protein